MKTLAILALLCAFAGCASSGPPPSPEAQAAAQEDILEAVFRHQFNHNASAIQRQAAKYCLSLPGEASPSAAFLQRFAGNKPPVAAAGECERGSGKNLFFRIQRLDWHGENEVWVRGGYWEGNLSSSVESFRVVRKDGKWTVEGARMEAIS
jgi:predicted small lipoprotein YifL